MDTEDFEETVDGIVFNLYVAPRPLERSELTKLYSSLMEDKLETAVSQEQIDEAIDHSVAHGFLEPLSGERYGEDGFESFTKYSVTETGEEALRDQDFENEHELESWSEEILHQYMLGEKPLDSADIRRQAREQLEDEFGYEPPTGF